MAKGSHPTVSRSTLVPPLHPRFECCWVMPGKFSSLKQPHYPAGWKLVGNVLMTSMWLWVLIMCKEKGPYVFVSWMIPRVQQWLDRNSCRGTALKARKTGQQCGVVGGIERPVSICFRRD